MSGEHLDRSKVRPAHLERAAFVYVRQSSLKQVRENVESGRRQYGFADQARALGWSEGQIVILDEDQGRSGATPQARPGFARLIGAVARAEVGIVMSLEVSRLSRNDTDWHHLVHLCRWTATLIADEHGVYDPTATADRMVLGIRGQVSELERDSSVHRMVEARWAKARRGEVFTAVPSGYDVDATGQVTRTSDETVADAVTRVFEKFDELGTARQVFVWWQEHGLPFPARQTAPGLRGVAWVSVSYRAILQVLHHPFYAGAYVFGRTETRRELDPEDARHVLIRRGRRSRERWPVLIRDHHPGYISFAKYLENQDRIWDNEVMSGRGDEAQKGAPREGRALLQGLVRCGQCGRRMMVGYGGERARRTLQYRCRRPGDYGRRECQLVGGKRVEAAVVEAFLEVTTGAGEEAAALADKHLRGEIAAAERTWQLQIEKAEYEARRAERQYVSVEPENRTVARELERRWEQRLVDLEAVRARATGVLERRRPLSEEGLLAGRPASGHPRLRPAPRAAVRPRGKAEVSVRHPSPSLHAAVGAHFTQGPGDSWPFRPPRNPSRRLSPAAPILAAGRVACPEKEVPIAAAAHGSGVGDGGGRVEVGGEVIEGHGSLAASHGCRSGFVR